MSLDGAESFEFLDGAAPSEFIVDATYLASVKESALEIVKIGDAEKLKKLAEVVYDLSFPIEVRDVVREVLIVNMRAWWLLQVVREKRANEDLAGGKPRALIEVRESVESFLIKVGEET
jgi:hypothetical protein